MQRLSANAVLPLLACFIVRLITDGSVFCLSVYYLPIQNEFTITNSKTTALFSLAGGMLQLTGVAVPFLLKFVSEHNLVIVGGLLAAVGMVLSRFCVEYYQLLIALGLLNGVGQGLAFVSAPIASSYILHHNHLQISMGVQLTGGGVGFFLFPILYQLLIAAYGLRNALLVTGAIVLNLTVCGTMLNTNQMAVNKRKMTDVEEPSSVVQMSDKQLTTEDDAFLEQPTVVEANPKRRRSLVFTPSFLLLAIAQFFHQLGFTVYVTFVYLKLTAAFSASDGESSKAASVMAVFGASSILSRIGSVLLTNRPYLRRWAVLCVAHLIEGSTMLLIALSTSNSLSFYAVLVCVQGLGNGLTAPLLNCVILDVLGPQRLADAFAYIMAVSGVASLLAPLLAGAIQDMFSSIAVTMAVGGAFELAACASLVLIVFVWKHYA